MIGRLQSFFGFTFSSRPYLKVEIACKTMNFSRWKAPYITNDQITVNYSAIVTQNVRRYTMVDEKFRMEEQGAKLIVDLQYSDSLESLHQYWRDSNGRLSKPNNGTLIQILKG